MNKTSWSQKNIKKLKNYMMDLSILRTSRPSVLLERSFFPHSGYSTNILKKSVRVGGGHWGGWDSGSWPNLTQTSYIMFKNKDHPMG